MPDSYLIEIIARLRDETKGGFENIKRQMAELQAQAAASDLSSGVSDLANEADRAEKSHGPLIKRQQELRRETQLTSGEVQNLGAWWTEGAKSAGAHGQETAGATEQLKLFDTQAQRTQHTVKQTSSYFEQGASSVAAHTAAHGDAAAAIRSTAAATSVLTDAQQKAAGRGDELIQKMGKLDSAARSHTATNRELEVGYQGVANGLRSVWKQMDVGTREAERFGRAMQQAEQKAKNTDLARSSNGFTQFAQKLAGATDSVFPKIVSLSAELRGLRLVLAAGFMQPLLTGLLSLGAGFFSIASGAAQAAATIGGVFVSGLGQLVPQISVAVAGLMALKNVFNAVQAAVALQQQQFLTPNQGLINQLSTTNALIEAELNLKNAYLQVRQAQEQLAESSLQILQARQALRKAEATGSQEAIQQAKLQLRAAELARSQSANSLVQARTGVGVAQRQVTIEQLTAAQPVATESQAQATLQYALSLLNPTEKKLYAELTRFELELRSPNSPLSKIASDFLRPFVYVGGELQKLLSDPKFLKPMDQLAQTMGEYGTKFMKVIFGPGGQKMFESLAQDASKSIPIVEKALAGFVKLLGDISKAAAPAFRTLSQDWSNFWNGLAAKEGSASGQKRLTEFFNQGARWAEDFAHLARSIVQLFMALGHDAAPQGMKSIKSLADAIGTPAHTIQRSGGIGGNQEITQRVAGTGAIGWVEQHGKEVTKFFHEANQGLGIIAKTLLEIGKLLVQAFSLSSLQAFSQLLTTLVLPAFKDFVTIVGTAVRLFTQFINEIGPLRVIFEAGLGLAFTLIAFGRLIGFATKAVNVFMGFKDAFSALKNGEGILGRLGDAWKALTSRITQGKRAINEAKTAQEELNGSTSKLGSGGGTGVGANASESSPATFQAAADTMQTAADTMLTAAREMAARAGVPGAGSGGAGEAASTAEGDATGAATGAAVGAAKSAPEIAAEGGKLASVLDKAAPLLDAAGKVAIPLAATQAIITGITSGGSVGHRIGAVGNSLLLGLPYDFARSKVPWQSDLTVLQRQFSTEQMAVSGGNPNAPTWSAAINGITTQLQSQLKTLGPQGQQQLIEATLQWAQTLQQKNPSLKQPVQQLIDSINNNFNGLSTSVPKSIDTMSSKTLAELRKFNDKFRNQIHQMMSHTKSLTKQFITGGGSSLGATPSSGPVTSGSWQRIATQLSKKMGWGPGSVAAWAGVENIEDGALSLTAKNPHSDAYGLAQFISGPGEYAQYGGNSYTERGQLVAMANYIRSRYGTPQAALAHEHQYGWYAIGGRIGDHIRRMGLRHLRRKILHFASGGRAPWGGEPVPIIAHEGERISNPGQWSHIASLAGMTPSGLDRHMGYDGTPRQFAAGGTVPYTATQGSTFVGPGSSMSFSGVNSFLQNITTNLAQIDVGSVFGSLDTISNLFRVLNQGFKKIGVLGGSSTLTQLKQMNTVLENFADPNNVDSTLNMLQTAFQRFQNNLSNWVTGLAYVGGLRAGTQVARPRSGGSVTGAGDNLRLLGPMLSRANIGTTGTTALDLLNERSLVEQNQYLDSEDKAVQDAIGQVKRSIDRVRSARARGSISSKTASETLKKLDSQYTNLIQQQETLGQSINSTVTQRFQAEQQYVQDLVSQINDIYQTQQSQLQGRQAGLQSLGQYGELPSVDQAIAKSAQAQIQALQKPLQEAVQHHDADAAAQIRQQIAQLRSTAAQAAAQIISDTISGIQQAAQTQQAQVSEYQSIAQTMQQNATTPGQFAAAGALNLQALNLNQSSMQSQLQQYNSLMAQAISTGNVGAQNTIAQQIDQLTAQLASNTQAIQDNTAQVVSETSAYIQARGQFQTGTLGGLAQIITTIGQTTGFTDVGALKQLVGAQNTSLQNTNTGLLGQLSALGGGATGLASLLGSATTPQAFVAALSGANIPGIEAGQDATWINTFESLLGNLEQNTQAIATNNQQLAQLNGQLLQPQQWSSTSWSAFRSAIFSGMGNLLPSYQAALAGTSAMPTIAPIFSPVSGGPTVVPSVGTLNVNHAPVSSLSPDVVGEQLANAAAKAL